MSFDSEQDRGAAFVDAIGAYVRDELRGRHRFHVVPPEPAPICPTCGQTAWWITGRWYCFATCGRFLDDERLPATDTEGGVRQ